MNSISFFDLSWHLALYSVGSNEGRNPCTCTFATRGTWRGARWISATIEPLELSLICICDGGEDAEASGWVRLILVATVCLRWMMLYGNSHCSYQRTWIPRSRYKRRLKCIDEYYPKTLWHCKMEALYECAWRSWRVTLCHGPQNKRRSGLVSTCILVPDLPEFTAQDACKTSTSQQTKKQRSQYQASPKIHAFTQAYRSLPTEKCKLKSPNYHDSWESCRHTVRTSTNTKTWERVTFRCLLPDQPHPVDVERLRTNMLGNTSVIFARLRKGLTCKQSSCAKESTVRRCMR